MAKMQSDKENTPRPWAGIPNDQNSFLILALTLLVLIPVLYWNSLNVPFVYDDIDQIQINSNIRITELSYEQLSHCWTSGTRPVAMVSFALNYYFGGLSVTGFHAVNILIHLTAALFLYLFVYHTLRLPLIKTTYNSHARHIAFLTTLLWATSPVQTQAVTYIVQRMTSMSAMFFIMSMYFYLKGRTVPKKRFIFFGLCIFSGLSAMGTKENAYMLPPVLFLYDFFLIQGLSRKNTRRLIKWACLLLPFCLLYAVKVYMGFSNEYAEYPFTLKERLLTEPRILFFYISLLIFPDSNRLVLLRDVPLSHSLLDPFTTGLSILGMAVILLAALIWARKQPLISFCAFFFFINHIIESSFLPLHLFFEHRIYLPSMLFFVPVSILFFKGIKILSNGRSAFYRYLTTALMVTVLLSQCYDTVIRNNTWKSGYTLWNDVVNKSPGLSDSYTNMGYELAKLGLFPEAEKAFKKAVKLDTFTNSIPRETTHIGLFRIYYQFERYEEAKDIIMIFNNSKRYSKYYMMGLIHLRTGEYEIAIDEFNTAWMRIKSLLKR